MSEYRGIEPEDIEKLKHLLMSSGWNDVVKPAILGRKLQAIQELLVEPEARTTKATDSGIREGVKQLDWVMNRFDQVVKEYDLNQLNDERLKQEQAP